MFNPSIGVHIFHKLGILAVLSLSTVLRGATPGFPFAEDFQLFDTVQSTAQWSGGGVTLDRAKGRHRAAFTMPDKRVGSSSKTAYVSDVALQDINGDGRLDVVVAGKSGVIVHFSTPASSAFSIRRTVVTTTFFEYLTFGDYDEDGDIDIVAGSWRGGFNVMLYKNNGRSGFDSGAAIASSVSFLHVNGLASADINGDGHLDLVLTLIGQNGGIDIYGNDGRGNFALQRHIDSARPHWNVAVGDLNGDNRPDIVLSKKQGSSVFHRNTGGWGFGPAVSFGDVGSSVALGDVNNDGRTDIVLGVKSGNNRWYLNDGQGRFNTITEIEGNHATGDVALGDMDGDGDLDLVEGVIRGQYALIYTNNGEGDFAKAAVSTTPVFTRTLALGDVDNDGDLDIATGNLDGTLKVKMNPGNIAASAPDGELFDTGHGWAVSSKVNAGTVAPMRVHLAVTDVRPANTDIAYYLSNDGGNRWHRAHPGGHFDFQEPGGDLRWGARLTSLSPTTSPMIVQVGMEGGMQVYIGGRAYKDGETHLAGRVTVGAGAPPSPERLVIRNRGKNALNITGLKLDFPNEGFSLPENVPNDSSPHRIVVNGAYEQAFLTFNPNQRGEHNTRLTISSRKDDSANLPDFTLLLKGLGEGPFIEIGGITTPTVRATKSRAFGVSVRNTGEGLLEVTTPTITDSQFSAPDLWPVVKLRSDDPFRRFPFKFSPENRGLVTATLTFGSNAINRKGNTAILKGKGLAPVIEVEIGGHFGEVPVNDEVSTQVTIKNTGDWLMEVTDVGFETTPAEGFPIGLADTSFSLPTTKTQPFHLKFRLAAPGRVTNRLLVFSDADNERIYAMEISGEGVVPEMDVVIGGRSMNKNNFEYSFGRQPLNESTSVRVIITNLGGAAPLTINPVSRSSSANAPFSWSGTSGTVRVPRHNSASSVLHLSFRPTSRGAHRTTLTITGNDFKRPRYDIALTGTGAAPIMEVALGDALPRPPSSVYSFTGTFSATVTQAMTIRNTGNAALFIMREPEVTSGVFSVEYPAEYSFPHLVEAMSSASFVLAFRPLSFAGASATMVISSNDLVHGRYALILQGNVIDLHPDFGEASVAWQRYLTGSRNTPRVLPAATSGDGVLAYRLTPALPAGLSFDRETRAISGTPTEVAAATTYTLAVTDIDGDTDTLDFRLDVQPGVCQRTPQVRDAITTGVAGVTNCADVTVDALSRTSRLDFWIPSLGELKKEDFGGLPNLRRLHIRANHLSKLPDGIFDNMKLDSLFLPGKYTDPFVLNVYPERFGNGVRARIDEAAPHKVHIIWEASSGSGSNEIGRTVISQGKRVSPVFGTGGRRPVTISLDVEYRGLFDNYEYGYLRYYRPWGGYGPYERNYRGFELFAPTSTNKVTIPGTEQTMEVTLGDVQRPLGRAYSFAGSVYFNSSRTHSPVDGAYPFGWAEPGKTITQVMTIRNFSRGDTALQIKKLPTLTGRVFSIDNPNGYTFPHSIEAMSSASFVLSFKPESPLAGTMTKMTILSNDPLQSTYAVILRGDVVDMRPNFNYFGSWAYTENYEWAAGRRYEVGLRVIPERLPVAAGGNGMLTYSLTPALPAGLWFDRDTHTLSGTPLVAMPKTYYRLMVTDANGDTPRLIYGASITVSRGICGRSYHVWPAIQESTDDNRNRVVAPDTSFNSNWPRYSLASCYRSRVVRANHWSGSKFALRLTSKDLSGVWPEDWGTRLRIEAFAGLGNMRSLVLRNNRMSSRLPARIFEGLNLETLRLEGNYSPYVYDRRVPVSFSLGIYLKPFNGGARAYVREGAPREIHVDWRISGGSDTTGTAIIRAGERYSDVIGNMEQETVAITLENPRFHRNSIYNPATDSWSPAVSGLSLAVPGPESGLKIMR